MNLNSTNMHTEAKCSNVTVAAAIFCVALAVRLLNLALIPDIDIHAMIEDSPMYWTGAAT